MAIDPNSAAHIVVNNASNGAHIYEVSGRCVPRGEERSASQNSRAPVSPTVCADRTGALTVCADWTPAHPPSPSLSRSPSRGTAARATTVASTAAAQ